MKKSWGLRKTVQAVLRKPQGLKGTYYLRCPKIKIGGSYAKE